MIHEKVRNIPKKEGLDALVLAIEDLHKTKKDKYLVAAYSILKNWDEAEDAVQEAFYLALTHVHKFRQESSLNTWIYRILINQCFKKNQTRTKEIEHLELSGERYFDVGDKRQNQVRILEDKEISDLISNCIDGLDAKYSLPMVLRHYLGFRVDQIGYILDIPQGTVKSRLHEARRKMAFLLEQAMGGKNIVEDFLELF